MGALVATRPTAVGVAVSGAAVSASDTISADILGTLGAYLIIRNGGGSSNTVAISDAGATQAGNASSGSGGAVANATNKGFYISPRAANPSTGQVTVTNSFITSVTYELYPLG